MIDRQKTTCNISITKEMLKDTVINITEINRIDKYLLVVNPQNNAIKQKDLAENVTLCFDDSCPIDKGYLIKEYDYLRRDQNE